MLYVVYETVNLKCLHLTSGVKDSYSRSVKCPQMICSLLLSIAMVFWSVQGPFDNFSTSVFLAFIKELLSQQVQRRLVVIRNIICCCGYVMLVRAES